MDIHMDPHMDIYMGIPHSGNHIPIPIPFQWGMGIHMRIPIPTATLADRLAKRYVYGILYIKNQYFFFVFLFVCSELIEELV